MHVVIHTPYPPSKFLEMFHISQDSTISIDSSGGKSI